MWWFMTFYSLYDIWYHPFIIRHRTPRDSPPKGPGHVLITKPVESRGPGAIRALGISQRVFLDRFFGGKKNNPTSSKIICLLSGSFELTPKKPFQADPFWSVFLTCFIEYHRYEFMISLLEVMQKKSPPWHEEMQLKHGQLWRLLRHGGYIVTETQAGKKKTQHWLASRRNLGHETICKANFRQSHYRKSTKNDCHDCPWITMNDDNMIMMD